MNIELLPTVLQNIIIEVENLMNYHFKNRNITLPVKIKHRKQNIIISWNIFEGEKTDIIEFFQKLTKLIVQILKNVNGETINFEINKGDIIDRGLQEFQVHEGKIWEVYLFDPEIFIYLRLLLESRIQNLEEKWISIDIDVVHDSAWFVD